MAFYMGTKSLFRTNKYADMLLVSNGRNMPLHRSIVCTQSALMGQTVSDGGVMNIVEMPEDTQYVFLFMSVIYCGNYPDTLFGENQEPHAMALLSPTDMKLILGKGFCFGVNAGFPDKHDDGHVVRYYRMNIAGSVRESRLLRCLTDATWVYLLGDKYDAPTVRLVAMYRVALALETLFDTDDLGHDTIVGLMRLVNEVYNKSRPDAALGSAFRFTYCSALRAVSSQNRTLGDKMKMVGQTTITNLDEFRQDMARAN